MTEIVLSSNVSNLSGKSGDQTGFDILYEVNNRPAGQTTLEIFALAIFFPKQELRLSESQLVAGATLQAPTEIADQNNGDSDNQTDQLRALIIEQLPLDLPGQQKLLSIDIDILNGFNGAPINFAAFNPSQPFTTNQVQTVSIADNDPVISPVNISINPTSGSEADATTFTITVTADSAVSGDQTVDLALTGSATGDDFNGNIPSTIIIANEETTGTATVTVTDDDEVEEEETATFTISNPSAGLTLGGTTEVSATIGDNDDIDPLSLLDDPLFRFRNQNVQGTYLFVGQEERENVLDNFSPPFVEEGFALNVSFEENDALVQFNRFQSTFLPGTYIFADEAESQSIRENFSDAFREEGIAFYALGADANLGEDVIRFRNRNNNTYLFALSEEAQSIEQNFSDTFVREGVAFQVST